MRAVTKADRESRSMGRIVRRSNGWRCSCFYCVGRVTARFSPREIAVLSDDPLELAAEPDAWDWYFEMDLGADDPWWPLDEVPPVSSPLTVPLWTAL